MNVKSFFDNATSTFSHVAYSDKQSQCAVIDPVLGFDVKTGQTDTAFADDIIAFIRAKQLDVEWILETHIHADHLTAATYIKQKTGGRVAAGRQISQVQAVFTKLYNLQADYCRDEGLFDYFFAPDEIFKVGDINVQALHVPGHTPADMAYYFDNSIVFVGDTIFPTDVGTARCDFPGGDASALYQSIQRILSLPADTRLFMCHDYPPNSRAAIPEFTVEQQKKNNIHLSGDMTIDKFINMRQQRDKSLAAPALLIPSIQMNIRAGVLPPAENDGKYYFKLPIK